MNNNFTNENNIRLMRLVGIAVVLCAVLGYAINFSYNECVTRSKTSVNMQESQNENQNVVENESERNNNAEIFEQTNTDESEEIFEADKNKSESTSKNDNKTFVEIPDSDNPILESIDETNNNEIKTLSQPTYTLENALKYKNSKEYTKALDEYSNILKNTSDINVKAICYQEISYIYAVNKRYGTALSYAQKAYNLVPNSERELLLARLYYKTGDIESASKRVNNILKRDFFIEN